MRLIRQFACVAAVSLLAAGCQSNNVDNSARGSGTGGNAAMGRAFALEVCTPCHVVAPSQLSPFRFTVGPDFTAVANAPTTTAMGLNVFFVSPHPSMPNLILNDEERADVIAYILSLKRAPKT